MIGNLVCPSQDVIDWVASIMRGEHKFSIERREKLSCVIGATTREDRQNG